MVVPVFASFFCVHFTMSVCRWNTSFEREQLQKLTHTIALYESNYVAALSPQEMGGIGNGNNDMLISDSSSSSSSSAFLSSSSSSSSSSLSSLCNISRMEADDELVNLVITTQQLNRKINLLFTDHHVQWGKFIHIDDLLQSECIENCQMRKDCLMILSEKLWPKMHNQLVGI